MRRGVSVRAAVLTGALSLTGGLLPAVATAAPSAPSGTPTAVTRPDGVHGLGAFDVNGIVRLSWSDPTTPIAGITVRYATGQRPPSSPSAGTGVPLRTPRATSAPLTDLVPGARYAVAVWTYNSAHRYSLPVVTRFTTLHSSEPGATIAGTITDTRGHPLGDAKVYVETFNGLNPISTRTDSAGQYALGVDPGSYYVGVDGALAHGGVSDATGYQSDFESVENLAPGETRSGVDAALAPGAAITGRVADAAGHPLAGVVPSAQPVGPYVQTTTNSSFVFFSFFGPTDANPSAANGTFAIKGLPVTTVQVCLDPTLNPVHGGTSDQAGYVGRCSSTSVTVRPGRSVDVGSSALRGNPGGVITGLVTDPSGNPASGVFIEVTQLGRHSLAEAGYGFTDGAGHYRISVGRGSMRVCADPQFGEGDAVNALSACTSSIRVGVGDVVHRNIRLRPAAALAGHIVGPDGQPVADALVQIDRPARRFDYGATAFTDEHGQFEAVGLATGDYQACVSTFLAGDQYPTGAAPRCFGHRSPLHVVTGAVRLGMDGRLGIGGAISGHVTDDAGAPTSEAVVDITGAHGRLFLEVGVNPDGSYTVDGLREGTYRVCASWFPPFDGTGAVFGVSFEEPCRSAPVSVTAGQTTAGVDRSVATGGSVRVSVHDTDGQPIGGVDVAALTACPSNDFCADIPLFDPQQQVSVVDSQVTAADGTITLHGLAPGQYAICLFGYYGSSLADTPRTGYADSCGASTFNVEVVNHQTTDVQRELAVAGEITGTVTDAQGNPLAGVQVVASNAATSDYVDAAEYSPYVPDGPAADAVTDAQGHFVVRGVTPGDQTVCVNAARARGGSSRTGYLDACVGGPTPSTAAPVSVHAHRITDVRLSLTAGAAISGTVTLATGHSRFIEVLAVRGRHGYLTGVARDGNYQLRRLPAGTYRVCFFAYPYQAQCFDNVPWNETKRIPRRATALVLSPGTVRRHVDAVLRRSR